MAKSKSLEVLKAQEEKLKLKRDIVSGSIPIPIKKHFESVCKSETLNKSAIMEKLITNWMLDEGYLY